MRIVITAYKELPEFSSGSGIEFYDDKLYLVGDDARDVLVMNRKWKPNDLITLFDTVEERLAKTVKTDLEAITLLWINKKPHLLILGSGSAVLRNRLILLNLHNKETLMVDISPFYERLSGAGITNINIEGAAVVHDYLILSNRASNENPVNTLIITSLDFYRKQNEASFQLVKLEAEGLEGQMSVSGITYSDKHEMLLLTTTIKNISADTDEITTGKSGLALIENFYRKIGREKGRMKINNLLDLSADDERFKGYEVESVCIQSEKDHSMKLHLAAGNNTGISHLFKAQLKLRNDD